jgi:hypothetical protein
VDGVRAMPWLSMSSPISSSVWTPEREQLQKLREDDVSIELFPQDKNETDLELAIDHAISLKPEQIIIIAALVEG